VTLNEADTRYHLIDPVLRDKGYISRDRITLETVLTPPPVEPTGPKGRRRRGPGRTDYLLCVESAICPGQCQWPCCVSAWNKGSDSHLMIFLLSLRFSKRGNQRHASRNSNFVACAEWADC
jgi:hypothetical protein